MLDLSFVRIACIAGFVFLLSACSTLPHHGTDASLATEPVPSDSVCEIDDLFERIRNGFAIPDIHNDLVLRHQQRYMNHPESLRRMVIRGTPYLYHIVDEIEQRGMPMEIALLPMVESAFNPMAYSRARASGLWQFIPTTGKRFNLDQDWWKDERRDIVASTSAALDYLQILYEMHGDWHLALASYNWGAGAVTRAIQRNISQNLPTDYLSLTMPNETRNYVPKLQALENIFSNPYIFAELGLERIPNQRFFSTITKSSHIDISLAATLADMSLEEFVALNPSSNRPIIKSGTRMVIPKNRLDTFISNYEEHKESEKPLLSWQSYTLQPGDKLEMVAHRFGMTVANLKAVNGIRGPRVVEPGRTLLVASNGEGGMLDISALASQPFLHERDIPQGRTHVVRRGDTLHSIARRYNTSVAELKRLNRLSSNNIRAGATLQISGPRRQLASNQRSSTPRTNVSTSANRQSGVSKTPRPTQYTIRKGDTLYSIARRFNVSHEDLMRWNHVNPRALIPGRTLTIKL